MDALETLDGNSGDRSWAVLQSLLCLLREKNILSRGDIEDLCEKLQNRATRHDLDPLPCCPGGVTAAADEMAKLGDYIGRRYGGRHRRA